jgi:DNA-binding CsgD family transcriptional regulator
VNWTGVREVDLRRVLAAGDPTGTGVEEPPADMASLLRLLAELVPCDGVSWSRLDVLAQRQLAHLTHPGEKAEFDDTLDRGFWKHYDEHPLCHGRGAGLPVARLSDVIGRRDLGRTGIYRDYIRPLGVEHILKVDLRHPPGQTNVLMLERGRGRDFDDRHRLLLTVLRPHLDAAVRRFLRPTPRLTPREREVLTLVREGLTNRAVARRLGVSAHTIRKHLENAFARLGVSSRTAAVAALEPRDHDV